MARRDSSRPRPRDRPKHPSTPVLRTPGWATALIIVALAVGALWVFAPLRHAGFAPLDDAVYVSANPHVLAGLTTSSVLWAFATGTAANWHPVTWISYLFVVSVFGAGPGPQHVANVALHLANVVLLFALLRRLTGATTRSAIVAGLFAVHPLHVESVAWIAERKDVLSACFWLLTTWAYVDYVRSRRRLHLAAVVALFALGLMAKPMLVTLPFTLLLLDVWPLGRVRWRRPSSDGRMAGVGWAAWRPLVIEKVPLFVMAAAASTVTFVVQRRGGAVKPLDVMPFGLRVENAVVSYVVYLGHACWPSGLIFYYPHPAAIPIAAVLLSALFLVGVTIAAWRLAERTPAVLTGWLWYLGTLVPVIGLVQVGAQSMADRYTYVPLIGIFVAVVWATGDLLASQRRAATMAVAAAALVITGLAVAARAQVEDWQSADALWTRALSVVLKVDETRAAQAVVALSDGRGGVTPDIARFFQLPPAAAHAFLGEILDRAGDEGFAEASFREALATDPDLGAAHDGLGRVLGREGRFDDAITEFQAAERLTPDEVEPHRDLGFAYAEAGRLNEAIAEDTEALRLSPGMAEVENNLGSVLARSGRLAEAVIHFRTATRLNPNLADAHRNLGLADVRAGNAVEAEREFREVLRLVPDDPIARKAIGGGKG